MSKQNKDYQNNLDAIKIASRAPKTVGVDILDVSPARGPVEAFQPLVRMPDGESGYKYVHHGYRGRDAMRERDVFDVMRDQVKRRKASFPLTDGQVGTARFFRALHERVNSSGYKLSNLEQSFGGGDSGAFMDNFMVLKQKYEYMSSAIGDDLVLDANRSIQCSSLDQRKVVLGICISQNTPSKLLLQFGWPNTTRRRQKLVEVLANNLDAMARASCY